jgi:hypothetical protein
MRPIDLMVEPVVVEMGQMERVTVEKVKTVSVVVVVADHLIH